MAEKFYKPVGETSFQCVERFRASRPELVGERLSFAGRLDPMAEGEMLILIGADNDNRDAFLKMDKKYDTEFVFGIETDSFDLMGVIKEVNMNCAISGENTPGKNYNEKTTPEEISKLLLSKVGKQMQKFPPYSKRHVKGKAMFVWASEGRLDEIEIPEHEIEIYSIEITKTGKRSLSEIANEAIQRIQNVQGDFRQEKIIAGWKEILQKYSAENLEPKNQDLEFPTISFTIKCSTGTYIRQLAQDIGKEIGCGALTYSIKRTYIG